MRKVVKRLVQVLLIAVFVVLLGNLVVMNIAIAETDAEEGRLNTAIQEQKLKNVEMEDILAEENADDFYRNYAEDNLEFGRPNEKVYQDISGY